MFFKKTSALKKLEPTEEQLREEEKYAEKNAARKTTTGETTKILQMTFGAIDKSIEETRVVKQAAKKLQESVSQLGAHLRHPKKA